MFNWELLVGAVVGVAGTVGLGVATLRHNQHRDTRAEQRELDREAAAALIEGLVRVRALLEQSWDLKANVAHPRRVSEALAAWKATFHKYRNRIPHNARNANRDLASALGEAFGLTGASSLMPDSADYPLAEYDDTWADNALLYVGYMIDWFEQWHYDPERGRKRLLLGFDCWLDESDKHLEAVANGTAFDTPLERILFRLFGSSKRRA